MPGICIKRNRLTKLPPRCASYTQKATFPRSWLFVYVIWLMVASCTDTPHGKDFKDYFSKTSITAVQGTPLMLNEADKPLSYLFNMTFFDSLILVNEFLDKDYTYKLVDLRDMSVRPFGKKGDGPGQLLSDAFYFSVDFVNADLYLTDNVHYYIYDIGDLKSRNDVPKKQFTIDQREKRFMGGSVYSGGYIVGSMYHIRFGAYNIENGTFIEKEEYKGGASMALANQAFFMNHPTDNKVVYCMSKVPEFGILAAEDGEISVNKFSWGESTHGVMEGEGTFTFIPSEEITYEFISVATCSEFIYILYSGKQVDRSSGENMIKSALSDEVFVLDWEGKPVKRYKLNQKVRSIAVDERGSLLYAASYEEDPKLILYELK